MADKIINEIKETAEILEEAKQEAEAKAKAAAKLSEKNKDKKVGNREKARILNASLAKDAVSKN